MVDFCMFDNMFFTNIPKLKYTYQHRQAFRYTAETILKGTKYLDPILQRAEYHDLDKSLLLTLIPKSEASEIHRSIAQHHMENSLPKNTIDLVEALVDYECAGYTKLDKRLNAYDTIKKFNKNNSNELLTIAEELGINYSYENDIYTGFSGGSEQDILKEIEFFYKYHRDLAENALSYTNLNYKEYEKVLEEIKNIIN